MSKLNKGIILEDCLISFLLLSTYMILMTSYMLDVYNLKSEIDVASEQINTLKSCMLTDCELSRGNSVRQECKLIRVKTRSENVCVQI